MKRVWDVINKPFTLWLFSIIFVGILGAIYSDLQQCYSEANQAWEDYRNLSAEVIGRREDLYFAIRHAKSVEELRTKDVVRNWRRYYILHQFEGRTLRDIELEWIRVGNRLTKFPTILRRVLTADVSRKLRGKINLPGNFDFERLNFSELTENDLPALKLATFELSKVLREEGFFSYYLVYHCSPWFSIKRLVFGDRRHLGELRKYDPLKKE